MCTLNGVSKRGYDLTTISNWEKYHRELEERIGIDQTLTSQMIARAQKNLQKVVFADGEHAETLRAVQIVLEEKIAEPILMGSKKKIQRIIEEEGLNLEGVSIMNPFDEEELLNDFAGELFYSNISYPAMLLLLSTVSLVSNLI